MISTVSTAERLNVLLIMAKDIIFLDAAPARRVKN